MSNLAICVAPFSGGTIPVKRSRMNRCKEPTFAKYLTVLLETQNASHNSGFSSVCTWPETPTPRNDKGPNHFALVPKTPCIFRTVISFQAICRGTEWKGQRASCLMRQVGALHPFRPTSMSSQEALRSGLEMPGTGLAGHPKVERGTKPNSVVAGLSGP